MVTIQNPDFKNISDYVNGNAIKCLPKYPENVFPAFQFKHPAAGAVVTQIKLQKPDLTLIDPIGGTGSEVYETATASYVTIQSAATYVGGGICDVFRFRVKIGTATYYYSDWFDTSYTVNAAPFNTFSSLYFKNSKDVDGYLFSEGGFAFIGSVDAKAKFIGVGEETELSKSNGLNYLVQSSVWDIYQIKFTAIPSVARLLARASHWDYWEINQGVFLGYPEIKLEPNLDLFNVTITFNLQNAYISPQIPNETIITP